MGEAFLTRRGGGALLGITVIQPPGKTTYLRGERIDMTGAVIGADIGGVILPLNPTAWTASPTTPLTQDTQYITVTASAGGRTVSTRIPITVQPYSSTLAENTWEAIAGAAELGDAATAWSVGDAKNVSVGGVNYTFRIIGFNHDALHTSDAKYGTAYNGGTNKAGISFLCDTNLGPAHASNVSGKVQMHHTAPDDLSLGWDNCDMRTTVLPDILAAMGDGLPNLIRTASKKTGTRRGSGTSVTYLITGDKLWLPHAPELQDGTNASTSGIALGEWNGVNVYAAFENWTGQEFFDGFNACWLRGQCTASGEDNPGNFNRPDINHGNKWAGGEIPTARNMIRPGFCL